MSYKTYKLSKIMSCMLKSNYFLKLQHATFLIFTTPARAVGKDEKKWENNDGYQQRWQVRIRVFCVKIDGGWFYIHMNINPRLCIVMYLDDTNTIDNKLIDIVRLYIHLVDCQIGQEVIHIWLLPNRYRYDYEKNRGTYSVY